MSGRTSSPCTPACARLVRWKREPRRAPDHHHGGLRRLGRPYRVVAAHGGHRGGRLPDRCRPCPRLPAGRAAARPPPPRPPPLLSGGGHAAGRPPAPLLRAVRAPPAAGPAGRSAAPPPLPPWRA